MNIFKASPEEFKKVEEEFKKTYIGRIMHMTRIIYGITIIAFIVLFIGQVLVEMVEGIEFSLNEFLTQAMIFLTFNASMFIMFSIYFLGLIHYANSKK